MAAPPILSGSTIPYRLKNNGFLPTQVGSGSLQLWLDSSDINVNGVRPVEGQQLNSWNDKSGLGQNVTGGSIKPIYQAGGVYFSGGAGFTTSLSDSLANETIFIVVKYSGSTFYGQSLLYPASSGGRLFYIRNNTLVSQVFGSETLLSYGTTSTSNINLVCSLKNNVDTSVTHFIDGSNVAKSVITYSGSSITYLGTDNYLGTVSLTGTIYEVICYNSALSSIERQQVESYLAWKWNIKLNTFLPNQLLGLDLWLDSSDLGQDGSFVSTWPNKSSVPHSVTTGPGPTPPTTLPTGVYFTGGSGFYTDYLINSTTTDETIFIVFQYANVANDRFILYKNSAQGKTIYINTGNVLTTLGPTQSLIGGTTTTNSLVLITTRNTFTSGIFEQFVNGTFATSRTGLTYNETAGMLIGTDNFIGLNNLEGYISEIIIYKASLSDTNRQKVENYLAVKWNLNRVLSSIVPTSISGLQIWLDATDINGNGEILNNYSMTSWANKSSSGITILQTGSGYPVSSNKSVIFSGTSGFTTTYTKGANETVFAILTPTSMSAIMNILYPSIAGNRNLYIQSSKLITNSSVGGLSNGTISISNITLITTQIKAGIDIYQYINGYPFNSTRTAQTPTTGTTYIGIDTTNTAGFIGTINELIIYNTALSDTDRQNIESYLTKKWIPSPSNLPISHPYYYNNISANTSYILSALPRNINGSNAFNSNNYPLISNNFRTSLGLTFKSFP